MLKGNCNNCLHGDLPEDCETCTRCGIARKNYAPIKTDEYISREAAINACYDGFADCRDDCAANIKAIPAADVAPIVHAHWEQIKFDCGDWIGICSNCGSKCPADNYCGACGAKMGEDNNE